MRVAFKNELGQWIKATNKYERIIAHAATAAVRKSGTAARDAARANIAAAGFGPRWQRSMKSVMHPPHGDVLNPWAWVHSTINFSDVFEHGATIRGAPWLWLPLPSVPSWPGDPTRQMSPRKYVETIGPLVTMRRPGKTPMLGAVVRGIAKPQPWGAFARRARLRRGASGRGLVQVIPLFVGVNTVTIEKRFDTASAMKRAAEQMPKFYQENLEKYEGR